MAEIEIGLQKEPLENYQAKIGKNGKIGAICTFDGLTRDNFENKTVVHLEYEAYEAMALKVMRHISEEAIEKFGVKGVVIVHRLGSVKVGEISVKIQILSAHRKEGIEGMEYVINRVKATVPIWKKEIYTDGSIWKQNNEFAFPPS
eukprot:comp10103_c0_seq1/m.11996 comp10103_c0_seq1/g.11996  ORF comp10103_c0_seq1/g.11996 comp10103_c0_seq1/m.11996 type:complete len:146 (+) comp10103_c0_seq1:289-726(+)